MVMNDKICTPFELKQFAYMDNTDAFDFLKFIESYSCGKYTVVEKQLIIDAIYALNYYCAAANDIYNDIKIHKDFKEKWEETLRTLSIKESNHAL